MVERIANIYIACELLFALVHDTATKLPRGFLNPQIARTPRYLIIVSCVPIAEIPYPRSGRVRGKCLVKSRSSFFRCNCVLGDLRLLGERLGENYPQRGKRKENTRHSKSHGCAF